MRVIFHKLRHRDRLSAGAVLLVAAMGAVTLSLHPRWELFLLARPSTCLLKVCTGLPCLACRGTRATLALMHGHIGTALRFNPLATVFVAGVVMYSIFLSITGKYSSFKLSRVEAIAFWTLLVSLLLGNWAYVIWQGG